MPNVDYAANRLSPPVPQTLRVATAVVGVEAVALLAASIVLIIKTLIGHPDTVGRALAIVGFAIGAAAVLALCGRGLMRLRPSSRSPIVLMQLLALPVTVSLGFQAGRILIAAPIMIAALSVLILLLSPSARTALDRIV